MSRIQTYTGRMVDPLRLRPEDVDVLDVAHALGYAARFAGHTNFHYSVAQHSVLVARLVPTPYERAALLHDAAEAYLLDQPAPVKDEVYYRIDRVFVPYRDVERRVLAAICTALGVELADVESPAIKQADRMMLRAELEQLKPPTDELDRLEGLPELATPVVIRPLRTIDDEARALWMGAWRAAGQRRAA